MCFFPLEDFPPENLLFKHNPVCSSPDRKVVLSAGETDSDPPSLSLLLSHRPGLRRRSLGQLQHRRELCWSHFSSHLLLRLSRLQTG